jgi:hypothetical protein
MFCISIVVVSGFIVSAFRRKKRKNSTDLQELEEAKIKSAKIETQRFSAGDKHARALLSMSIFSIVVLFCGMIVSILNQIQQIQTEKGTYYLFGRYYEYLALPLILLGFYFIFSNRVKVKTMVVTLITSILGYAAISIPIQLVLVPNILEGTTKRYNIYGVLPYIGNSFSELFSNAAYDNDITHYNLLTLGLITMGIFTVLTFLFIKKRGKLSLMILAALFAFGIGFNLLTSNLSRSSASYNTNFKPYESAVSELHSFDALLKTYPSVVVVGDDLGKGYPPRWNDSLVYHRTNMRAQLIFNRFTVVWGGTIKFWDKERDFDKLPANYFIVSSSDIGLEKNLNYKKVLSTPTAAVWIYGKELVATYIAEGGKFLND